MLYFSKRRLHHLVNTERLEVGRVAQRKVGTVSHYYNNIGVAIVDLTGALATGDKIKITGKSDEFTQTVDSMELEHKKIEKARKGQSIGVKFDQRVREGDTVYKVT